MQGGGGGSGFGQFVKTAVPIALKVFGLEDLKGYDSQRIYAYLAERYLSFWFTKHCKTLSWPWTLFDPK